MRLNKYLKEATYKSDKQFRKEAEKAYTKLIKYLKKVPVDSLMEYKPEKGIAIFGKEIGYPDIIFIINPGRGMAGFSESGTTIGGKKYAVIMLYGLKRQFNDLTPEFMGQSASAISKGTFIHEFIHYLDAVRGNFENSVDALSKGGDKAYFNTASEFNAYFQEISTSVENIILAASKLPTSFSLDKWLTTFDGFIKATKAYLKNHDRTLNDFYNLLNKKYKRKFIKRLYTLYEAMVNKYM